MLIRRKRGQWTLLGNFSQTLGFTFYRGRPVGWLSVVVAVERDIFVLDCEPLSRWEPKDLSEGLLVQDSVVGS